MSKYTNPRLTEATRTCTYLVDGGICHPLPQPHHVLTLTRMLAIEHGVVPPISTAMA